VSASFLPALTVLVPALAAVAVLMAPAAGRRAAGLAGALLSATAVVPLVLTVKQGIVLTHAPGGWGAALGIELRADGLAAFMLLFTAVVGLAASVYAFRYFSGGKQTPDVRQIVSLFWPVWLLQWSGLNALFLSADLFNLYVTLEVVSLASVSLVALAGTPAAVRAAARYLFLALLGSLSYLLGVGLLYSACGVLDLYRLADALDAESRAAWTGVALITAGLLVKTALVPLHYWLPRAHADAPAPVSAILSGLVVTAAYYLFFRFWFQTLEHFALESLAGLLGVLGSLAIAWGGWQALHQERLKLVVAYSTVSQIGYLFLVFPLTAGEAVGEGVAWAGATYFAVSQGVAKAAAFFAAGSLLRALGTDRVHDLRGVGRRFPMTALTFAIAGVNIMGLPPTGGFVGKWMLLKAAFLTGQWVYALVIVAGGLLGAAYIFRVLERFMAAPADDSPAPRRIAAAERLPALFLALTAVALTVVTAWLLDVLRVGAPVAFTSFVPREFTP
jgi:formate hydrogenlyase subunit 3/multisubunit Na+/H+ antiporter MnhD subunit